MALMDLNFTIPRHGLELGVLSKSFKWRMMKQIPTIPKRFVLPHEVACLEAVSSKVLIPLKGITPIALVGRPKGIISIEHGRKNLSDPIIQKQPIAVLAGTPRPTRLRRECIFSNNKPHSSRKLRVPRRG